MGWLPLDPPAAKPTKVRADVAVGGNFETFVEEVPADAAVEAVVLAVAAVTRRAAAVIEQYRSPVEFHAVDIYLDGGGDDFRWLGRATAARLHQRAVTFDPAVVERVRTAVAAKGGGD
jgi:hypothetical protein